MCPSIKDFRTINKALDKGVDNVSVRRNDSSILKDEEERLIVSYMRNKNRAVEDVYGNDEDEDEEKDADEDEDDQSYELNDNWDSEDNDGNDIDDDDMSDLHEIVNDIKEMRACAARRR